jgi:hypothetical protein
MTRSFGHLSMCFSPSFELISSAREFVAQFYDAILDDPDTTSRVALTTQELLENATKYSTTGSTVLQIHVTREESGHFLSVRTSNDATPDHLGELQRRFDDMQRCADAFDYYTDLMLRTARASETSGLGLARVWAEGEMDVRCDIVGSEATITARTRVGVRTGASARHLGT